MSTLHTYDAPQLSSCNLNTACRPHQNPFPHLLPFGGDGKGTDRRASFATFGHFSLVKCISPNLLPFGGDGKGTDRQVSFATFGHFSLVKCISPNLLPFGGDAKGTDWRASFATFGHFSLPGIPACI
ncbi:hypothetical protein O181_015546 [Austropuccinia psidii MF-1]|uniref:Uncharacterized protein n=1 Tax=Austropuccinia psidii MF-1 TaxID=1389203 RepID=A0A9Q3C045_9BASI|nr:hypothetical protein [Austropuccinia psidii MF-1]